MSKIKLILVTTGTVVVFRQIVSLLGCLEIIEKPTSTTTTIAHAALNSSSQKSASNVSFGDLISAKVAWSQSTILRTEPNELFLQVNLSAKDIGAKHRPLVTTMIVIDRSGSMDGEKIEKTKLATLQAFKSLNATDSIGIVSYSNHAQVDLQPTLKKNLSAAKLKKTLDGIYSAGGTNIWDGVQLAIDLLEDPRTETLYKRILLISDGHATKGETNEFKLEKLASLAKEKGISISTMGVGNQYSEDLMMALSQSGGGNYYHVRRTTSIEHILSQEMSKAKEVLAQDVAFEFSLPTGFHLVKIFGYKHKALGNKVVVYLGDLSSADKRKFIAKVQYEPQVTSSNQLISTMKLQYDSLLSNQYHSFKEQTELEMSRDMQQAKGSIEPRVLEQVASVTLAEIRRQAAFELETGNYKGAKLRLRRALKKARNAAEILDSPAMRMLVEKISKQTAVLEKLRPETDTAKDFIKTEKYESRSLQLF
ncbi:MAG: VWA domain-containing protein [Myxococcota bacterium]|nr:VWA domain-containing protein [Myxococcota bacterium]